MKNFYKGRIVDQKRFLLYHVDTKIKQRSDWFG